MSALARMYCGKCSAETLHRGAACVHCKTPFVVVVPPSLSLNAVCDREAQMRKARRNGKRKF